jgi:hypothetical protein
MEYKNGQFLSSFGQTLAFTAVACSLPCTNAEVIEDENQQHQKYWRGNPGTSVVLGHFGDVEHNGPGTIPGS